MANEYVSGEELAVPLGIADSLDNTWLLIVATATSRAIDRWCGRRFYADTTATARKFTPSNAVTLEVDDLQSGSITSVKTDDNDDGTFETTWSASDYETLPLNSIGPLGYEGWPVEQLLAVESRTWPCYTQRRGVVEVTAKWGWTAVPDEVKQAAYILGAELFRRKEAPFGVAGISDFGVLRIREDARVTSLLAPFQTPTAAGLF